MNICVPYIFTILHASFRNRHVEIAKNWISPFAGSVAFTSFADVHRIRDGSRRLKVGFSCSMIK